MLNNLQIWLEPYLGVFGANVWMQAAVAIIGSLLLAWIFDRFVSAMLKKLTSRTRFQFDDYIIDHVHKPIHVTLILIGLALAVDLLKLDEFFDEIILSVLLTIGYIVWTVFLIRSTRALLAAIAGSEGHLPVVNPQTLPLFQNIALIAILVLSVYVIFTAWDVDMTAWLASAGIIGIAVGFAAKDTLANLFSGVFIMADAPYKIGDLTRDDVEVTVPNSVMGNTKIINESGGPHEKFRIRVAVGVAYGSDIDKVREILMDIGLGDEYVCEDPEPRVRFRRFGASSLDFELLCWINQLTRPRNRRPQLQGLQALHRRKSRNPLLQARPLHQANARVSAIPIRRTAA